MIDVVIIGAGISGLSAAYYLKKVGKNILLLESSQRAGGVIQSQTIEGFLLERGPNSLRGTHQFLDLVDALNLSEQLVTAEPKAPAYVYCNQLLQAVPMSPASLLKTKLLSTSAKLRLLKEPFLKTRIDKSEESLASFVRRRLGNEILENLVAPFVSGVYAGDPENLSVQAAFPRLAEFEKSGSVFRGAINAARTVKAKNEKPKRSLRPYRLCSFKRGLQTFTDALGQALGENLKLNIKEIFIAKNNAANFQITYKHDGQPYSIKAKSLIIATPAYAAAKLLDTIAPNISALLAEISYTSLVAVPLAYRVEQVERALDGFGFLAPRKAGLRTLGSIWNSSLFQNRAPHGYVLLNNFIGGETDRAAINLSDEELRQIVHADLQEVLGISGEPKELPITRWQQAIPQYNLGHATRVATIKNALQNHTNLILLGNYLHGVALGDCIKQGKEIGTELTRAD